jgi:nitrous oxidase accessory protein NosD
MRITIQLILILALMSTPAYAANLFVPDQHPTIQAAVDAATPGDRILVGPGFYAGAIIDKWVKISGEGDETVITDPYVTGPRFGNGFRIVAGADKTEISDLTIAISGPSEMLLTGIFVPSRNAPIKGVIRNVKIVGVNTAIQIRNSSGWVITGNTISDLREPPSWRFIDIGIWLNGTGNSLVANNTIESNVLGRPELVYVGINLSASPTTGHVDNNKIVNNTVSVQATDALSTNEIELFQGGIECDDAVLILGNKIITNQAAEILLTPPCLAEHNVIH